MTRNNDTNGYKNIMTLLINSIITIANIVMCIYLAYSIIDIKKRFQEIEELKDQALILRKTLEFSLKSLKKIDEILCEICKKKQIDPSDLEEYKKNTQ